MVPVEPTLSELGITRSETSISTFFNIFKPGIPGFFRFLNAVKIEKGINFRSILTKRELGG